MNKKFIFLLLIIFNTFLSFSQIVTKEDFAAIKNLYRAKNVVYDSDFGAFLVQKGKKKGLVSTKDSNYNILIPIEFDSIIREPTSYRNIVVWKDLNAGVYSSEFVQLLEPIYHNLRINEFDDGLVEYAYHNNLGIYDLRYEIVLIEPKYDSINFLNFEYSAGLFVVKKNGKSGLFDCYHNKLIFDLDYDKIRFIKKLVQDINGNYYDSYIEVWRYETRTCYDGMHLTDIIHLDGYSRTNYARLDYLDADTLTVNGLSSTGEFMARNRKSKKWGLYQNHDDVFDVLVPAKFDKVEFFEWGAPLTFVYMNGLKGYFLKDWEGNYDKFPGNCVYDDLVLRVDSEGRKFLAARIGSKWYWVDWSTGKLNRSTYYDAVDRMRMTANDLPAVYR